MSKVSFSSKTEYTPFDGFGSHSVNRSEHLNYAYMKQRLHEKKIDEFFWTDFNAPHKRHSPLAAVGAFLGVMIPTLMIGKKQHRVALNSVKNLSKAINVEYGIKEILATGLGGVAGGLIGGLFDRKEKNKLQKIDEASFQAMNIAFPAILVGGAMKMCSKIKILNNIPSKIAFSVGGILAGAWTAVQLSNKLDDKMFDKYVADPDRKLKKKDFIVHVDDFFATLILAKIPFAEKLHINKILPLIFTWSGYHVGDK